ncbi:YjgN family protein [Duganella sp. S19_KUP01_CR8]|uniref:YjgN family protein n=1 Tax=Duganella sp. S19_KUP01_CR8 TaxID=3025502 RepID=UPI002FCDDF99
MEQVQGEQTQRLRFHASGGEYFRIWIVNLLLTIVTLGIYSAWAKVRRNQYFYSSTELAGSSFEYHGNPVAILKGRIVAAVIFAIYLAGAAWAPLAAVVVALGMGAASPWVIWKSLQFRLHNTSYRGIRFSFAGDVHDAYTNYLVRPLLNGVTLGLATPFIHQRAKAWQHNESRYGKARFSFDGSVADFYKLYGGLLLIGGGGMVALFWLLIKGAPEPTSSAEAAGESSLFLLAFYGWVFVVYPLFMNMLQKLIWNHTSLEHHRFQSDMRWSRLVFITVTNYLAVICTLGLFLPFAHVRAMRYRLESMSLLVDGSLDDITAVPGGEVGATGEGMAEFMDYDLSL